MDFYIFFVIFTLLSKKVNKVIEEKLEKIQIEYLTSIIGIGPVKLRVLVHDHSSGTMFPSDED